ncbi:uncharacterized protein LOC121111704 isoform X1 [Gallus gallus]|uniref:uncharacterized protein LOC121111704 isoform X1 n=1 Tax=Gallus gallus TaxID=9031 RepID=UPI001F00DDDD|nr:uncharacterized protein LOC121111704 isoform X1 [Gallus gallus]XP_046781828.1 uncharacterized protein LOC121111704 isoform X1 [Gallus gallus]
MERKEETGRGRGRGREKGRGKERKDSHFFSASFPFFWLHFIACLFICFAPFHPFSVSTFKLVKKGGAKLKSGGWKATELQTPQKGRAGGERLEVRKRKEDERVGGPRPGEGWVRGEDQTGLGGVKGSRKEPEPRGARGQIRSPRPAVSVQRRPAGVALAPRSPRWRPWRLWLLPPGRGAAEGSAEPLFSGALRQPPPRAPPAPQRPLLGPAGVAVSIGRSRSRGAASVTENARRERGAAQRRLAAGLHAAAERVPRPYAEGSEPDPVLWLLGAHGGARRPYRHRHGRGRRTDGDVTSRPEPDGCGGGGGIPFHQQCPLGSRKGKQSRICGILMSRKGYSSAAVVIICNSLFAGRGYRLQSHLGTVWGILCVFGC